MATETFADLQKDVLPAYCMENYYCLQTSVINCNRLHTGHTLCILCPLPCKGGWEGWWVDTYLCAGINLVYLNIFSSHSMCCTFVVIHDENVIRFHCRLSFVRRWLSARMKHWPCSSRNSQISEMVTCATSSFLSAPSFSIMVKWSIRIDNKHNFLTETLCLILVQK